MAEFGFTGGSYQSWSLNADAQRSVNLFPEKLEVADPARYALYGSPGLRKILTLPTAPTRGIWQGEDRTFVVAGAKLYELFIGTVSTSGTTVNWLTGPAFVAGMVGTTLIIGSTAYTVATFVDALHLTLSTSAGVQASAAFAGYTQIGDVGNDGLPALLYPTGTQLLIVSNGRVYVAVSEDTILPALYPNRSGTVSIAGTAVTWTSGAQFDASMVGLDLYIQTVPYTVAGFTDATHITLASSPGTIASIGYSMALAVTGVLSSAGGTTVAWVSGSQFDDGMEGQTVAIAGVEYTVVTFTDATHLVLSAAVPASAGVAFSITLPVFASASAYLDGYLAVQAPSTKQINISALRNGLVWSLLDYAYKEAYPDNIAALLADHEELWVFGTQTTEIWRNTGAAAFPLERDPGAFIQIGCIAPASPVRLHSKAGAGVAWLGGDPRGWTIAYFAIGYAPQRISTHAVEAAWARYSRTSDAISYTYLENGHQFWVISFPTGNATWVYDATEGFWHERGYGSTLDRQRGVCHAYGFGLHIVGDWQDGRIYEMSSSVYTDDGTPIYRIRAAVEQLPEEEWAYHSRFRLGAENSGALNPALDWSVDGGHTFNTPRTTTSQAAGALAVYDYRRLGRARARVWRITITAAVKVALINAWTRRS